MTAIAPLNSGGGAGLGNPRANPRHRFDQHVVDRRTHFYEIKRAKAVAAEQDLWDSNSITVRRLNKTVDWIAAKCRDGELATFCRFLDGGALMPLEPSEWNVEYPLARFLTKGAYKRWFRTLKPVKQYDVYVFVDRADLRRAFPSA